MRSLITAARRLSDALSAMTFDEPVTHVYNPLVYARSPHERYLSLARPSCRVLFLGMNPGPWGMAQTGVPFGEIDAVTNWLGIEGKVSKPDREHPKRPIEGLACKKSEVSGRRLWGLMRERFATRESFFAEHFVANYCPLVFMESTARNRTPDKLPVTERQPMEAACDEHLRATIAALQCEIVVGVGAFAEDRLTRVCQANAITATVARILHPSPASPAANRDWAGTATRQLIAAGVWPDV